MTLSPKVGGLYLTKDGRIIYIDRLRSGKHLYPMQGRDAYDNVYLCTKEGHWYAKAESDYDIVSVLYEPPT